MIAAIGAGLRGYLVHTGKWRPDATGGRATQPTAEFDDLTAVVEDLVSARR